ncbi:unnamed protein product [Calypogeia fissa]
MAVAEGAGGSCKKSTTKKKSSKLTAGLSHSPEVTANWFSLITWSWLQTFMNLGTKKNIQMQDLYDLPPRERTEYVEKKWKASCEQQRVKNPRQTPRVWKLVMLCGGREMIGSFIASPMWLAFVIGQVFAIRALIWIAQTNRHLQWWLATYLVAAMLICSTGQSIALQCTLSTGRKSGMKIRAAVCMAVYNKLMETKLAALVATNSGEVIGLVTNDSQKLADAAAFAGFTFFSVVDYTVVALLAVMEVGVAALPGIAVLLLAPFIQLSISEGVGRMRARSVKITDTRIRTIQEILSAVGALKYNGWIAPFLARVQHIRSTEMLWIRRAAFLRGASAAMREGLAPFAALVTYATYVMMNKHKLTASRAFTILGLYFILVRVYAICPMGIQAAWESRVSIKRLQKILDLPTGKTCSIDEEEIRKMYPYASVGMSKGSFAWSVKEEETEKVSSSISKINVTNEPNPNEAGFLNGINFAVTAGELIAFIGPTGSGKSSLLYALLEEMEHIQGDYLMERKVSFSPQQPWILDDTIKENIILFGDYDEGRYKEVVFACALQDDIESLPAGDETEIGDRGVTLSESQKARVSLARACYSRSKVVLLDDPLAAVDVPTAKHLMQHVLGHILKGRTVILVTQNRRSIDLCDRVFVMDNGRLEEVASNNIVEVVKKILPEEDFEDLNLSDDDESKEDPSLSVRRTKDVAHLKENSESSPLLSGADLKAAMAAVVDENGTLTVKGDRSPGKVNWRTYFSYCKAGGFWLWIIVALLTSLAAAVRVMVDYWIGLWVSSKYGFSTYKYLHVHIVWVLGLLLLSLARSLLFTETAIRAAKSMHNLMATSVLRSPQLFFDQTPLGRIMNRFSTDQSIVDEYLPAMSMEATELLFSLAAMIVIIGVIFPWYLVSLPLYVLIAWYCQRRFSRVAREVKRLDTLSRSPIYTNISQIFQGITSVRAYGKESEMHDRFRDYIDTKHRACILYIHACRWLGIRLDLAASISLTLTALLAVLFRHSVSPGLIGVALIQNLQLTGIFQYTVRSITDAHTMFTSVEWIRSYANLPLEADSTSAPGTIPDGWPEKGKLEFIEYTMAYRVDLPPVLNSLTFTIHPQEKVGILGTKGAGKSSLAAALFRMVENSACSGSILIDAIDLKLVGLDDLRLRLSIVPQDPVLFSGTVRLNLDPFERYSDIEIHEALEKVQLSTKLKSMDSSLDSLITENKDNFSVGQLQLLCLARALLRRSKIIVIDEATAAVDRDTDKLIRDIVRDVFQDCTVLTIAHRIETVIDFDRLLILANGGRAVEFDSPINLLRNAEGLSFTDSNNSENVFASMVFRAGPSIAKQLRDAAEAAETRRLLDTPTTPRTGSE